MPGGLPEVSQSFTADISGYTQGLQAMVQQNRAFVASLGDVKRVIGDTYSTQAVQQVSAATRAIQDFGKAVGDTSPLRDAQRSFEALGVSVQGASAELAKASIMSGQTMRSSFATLSTQAQATARDVRDVGAAHSELAAIAQQHVRQASSGPSVVETIGTRQELSDASTGLRDVASRMADLETRARSVRSALSDVSSGSQGVNWASSIDDATAAIIARNLIRQGRGPNPAASAADQAAISAAMNALGGGGGGGGGYFGPGGGGGGAAAGGGGGYGGRGGWTAAAYASSGGGDMFPVGSAGHDASVITGFVKRWWTPVHFAIMTANELMATLLPAAAAAGAATLVGWQGAEQMIPRIQAINATAESLGGAYGITSGQYLGTGSAIQHYQNLAGGGVYELGGAGINLMRAGAGTFGQTGLSTIAMLDRGVADMQLNMAQRGTMGELGGLAGKGTGYLRQFGDIGANLGNIFLGLAPHLPGVGDDYLSALEGITGGLGGGIGLLNQHGMGNLLGAGMAFEAGWRVGKPVVGLAGKGLMGLGRLAGKIPGLGKAGLAEGDIGDIAALTGVDLGEGAVGLGGEGLASLLTGAGTGLGMLGGPEVGLAALAAFGISKAWTSQSPAQRAVSQMQAGIGNAGFSAAFTPLAKAITTTTGLAGAAPAYAAPSQMQLVSRAGPGLQAAYKMSPEGAYSAAAGGFEQTMGNLVNAGPQLVTALHKAGLKSVSMADAFQVAQNGLLDLNHAFDSHGQLTKQATQMLANYVSAIGPMTRSAGGFNAVIAGQQIMGSPAMKDLANVNQAMDSMTQVMTGGPAGMATLMGMLGGSAIPVKKTAAGIQMQAPPAFKAMAKALTSFTTGTGSAAWNTFAGSQGLITAEQQNMDQLRTYMTLGSMSLPQAQGVAGFQLEQLLPLAKKSPAALAMVMQQGAQMGLGGYYDPAKSQAQNFQAAQKAIAGMADSSKQVNKDMNSAVVASSNLPKTAMQFTQGLNANVMSQQVAQAAKSVEQIKTAAGKGLIDQGAVNQLVGSLKQAGITGGAALHNSLDAALKTAGVSKPMRVKIEAEVEKPKIPHIPDQRYTIYGRYHVPPPPHIPDQSFLIVGHMVISGATANAAAAGTPSFSLPGGGGMRIHAQTGGLVPGSGSGDIIPSMLEPGEAIVPRNLVPLVAPILAAHNVPGFGAMPKGASTHFAAGGIVPHMLGFPDPARISGNVGKDVAYSLVDGITKALNQAGAGKIAQALVSKIAQEVQYAKSISSSAQQGLNLGGMDTTQGSVADQMQSYLSSEQGFGKDIKSLRKQHLSGGIMSQLIAAGPVQGDLLAQSILQGGGTSGKSGVSQVNQLWAQIGKASNAIGAQAAMAKYGGHVSPDLKHAEASQSHVSISINVGSGGGDKLDLTPAQIKSITAQVQAALLKQAKRNPKTGLQLKGKGA